VDYRVQLAINLMKSDPARELSLREIASVADLSPSRLRYLFKNETGISPKGYLRILRMELAKELLKTTPLTVKQITIQVGVNDRSHFERGFKKAYGVTPVQYRASACMARSLAGRTRGSKPRLEDKQALRP
jgi:AraC family transcriptional regulator